MKTAIQTPEVATQNPQCVANFAIQFLGTKLFIANLHYHCMTLLQMPFEKHVYDGEIVGKTHVFCNG